MWIKWCAEVAACYQLLATGVVRGRMPAGDKALTSGAGKPMQAETAGRFAAAIEARNNVAVQVEDLTLGVDPQAGSGVVDDRCRPGGEERWGGKFIPWRGLAEVMVDAGVDEAVVALDRVDQVLRRHRHALMLHDDLGRQLGDAAGAEEVAVGIDVGRRWGPLLAFDGVSIEDRPYRAATIVVVAKASERTVQAGLSISGKDWGRPDDTLGFAGVINGLANSHEAYFAAGGLGILIGDGQLPAYGLEKILESYYNYALTPNIKVGVDYQLIVDPGYNATRGPANFFAARVHWQF